MKLRFQAIDSNGRVVRGVLRAEDDAAARDLMREEGLFAKTLEPVDEEEKVTWSPRNRIKAAMESRTGDSAEARRIVRSAFATRALSGVEGAPSGEAGLSEAGDFVFSPVGDAAEPLLIRREDAEQAVVSGFPVKTLRITLLSGKMYEFAAGMLLANGGAKDVVREFTREGPKAGGKKS
jgi:hypothetical protein